MKKRLLFFLAFLSLSLSAWSTHIVGGTLTYVYNGGSSYTFTLKLFRDCTVGTAAFPNTVTIAVRGYNGATFAPSRDFNMNLGTVTGIPSNLDTCAAPPNPMPCVEQGVYTTTVNNLPPNPGGYHCYYQVCCRNLSTTNINASCNCIGASVSTDIEGPSLIWLEDFTLTNGTTVDAGPTAWTRSLGTTPVNYASVQNNLFEFSGANNGQATWLSQQINISSFTTGVNLSAVLTRAGNLDLNDSVRTYYSINSGPFVQFTVNGALNNAFASPSTATAGPLIGNTVQIMVRAHFDGSSPSSELIRVDNVEVDGNNFLSNSSPVFTNFPPLFLCQGNFFTFNHAASDPNGDSLAYSFYTPFTDAAPTYTNNVINFTPVTFLAGFTTTQPIGAGGLSLNSTTGVLTGTPPNLGQFCVGICVKEYRNGNLLSTTYRDFQFNVVFCPPPAQALITPSGVVDACNGVNVTFPDNSSASANNWFWNFGDPATLADTSHAQYPTYTYSSVGTYTATLIINKGTPCADTSTATVHVGFATANFSHNAPQCAGSAVTFTNLSSCSSNTTISGYQWNFGDAGTSTATNPTHTYAVGGTYTVTLITNTTLGCSDTLQLPVTINPTPAAPAPSSNSPICAGSALNLTTSPVAGATYSWTGPNSFSSSSQNPTIASATTAAGGTYSLTITVSGCTSAAGTTAVTVNPIPAPPTASSNSPICAGSTLNLTASNVAGATYSWSGPNSFSSATQNPSIAGATIAASGTYSVNVTVAGCSSSNATTVVTVSPIPATPTASSNSPICAGSTLNLTASNVAGATYSWSGPNSFSSSTQNPSIAGATVAASGTYSVTATVAGCTGSAGTTVVTVNPAPAPPTASSNSPICAGSTLNLTASNIAGATYSWSGPNSFSSATQNPSIAGATVAASGTYSVTAIVAGCPSTAATTVVTVNPTPAPPTASSNSPICAGSTLNLTASNVAGSTYSWSGPNSFSSATQNPSIAGATTAASGTYSVNVTVAGCTSTNATTVVTVNPIPVAPTASSNSPICAGSTLNLTAGNIAGATYSWSGPNSFSSATQNPSIAGATVAASGTYSVTATVAGCTGSAGTTVVTVNPNPAPPTASSNSPICAGSTLNLTASNVAGATYSWSGPNSFSSATQNPSIAGATIAAAGTYSVHVTVAGCNSANATTAVTVNPIPAAPTASSNSPICVGSTLNLNASNVAGATYSWTGPNSFSAGTQNTSIPGATTVATGTYSVTVTVAGCTSAAGTTTATVNSAPATPIAGSNSPVCVGSPLNLTASLIAGATYSWSGPNSFSSTLQNPTIAAVTLAAAGTYTVIANNGCSSSPATVTVVVNPTPAPPTASSNSPICAGSTLNLTASNVAGATYSWSGPNSFSSSSQNPSIAGATVAASGTYSVNVTVGGCPSTNATTVVTVNPIPVAPTASSNSPLCTGSTLNLTATSVAGATYSWTGPNSFSSASQNPSIASVTLAAAGTYSVNVTVAGCTSSSPGTTTVVVNPTPTPPTASSNSPVCAGSTLNLTASNVAGATYSWTGPNSFSSSTQNPSIAGATVAASGTYSVTVTVSGCPSAAATTVVTVNPVPNPPTASSNSPLCVGSTLNLFAGNVAGATYSWSGPNSFSSSTQNPSIAGVTVAAAGTYSVAVTVLGCTSTSATTTVVVNTIPAPPTASSNSPVCTGNPINLTASTVVGATYSWTGPNGFTSSVQNPTIASATLPAAGTYSVTVNVGGCTSSSAATTTVVVNPTPVPPAITTNSPLCVGDNLTLNASNVVGATYSWNGPSGFSSSTQNNTIPNVTLSNAGTYTVNVTVNGCTSSNATSNVVIHVIPAPPTASSNSPVCTGNTLNLTASTVAGGTYSWTGPNGFSASTQNPSISNVTLPAAGTYSVNVTVLGCTSTSSGTTTVVINPTPAPPTATNNSAICEGSTLDLFASNVAGATYSWTGPNGFTSTTQNPSILAAVLADAGTYSVTVTVTGCPSAAATTLVIINPVPTAPSASSNSPICTGSTLNLFATSVAGATYSWTGPNGFTSSSQNPTIPNATTAATGTYTVNVTVNGCTSVDSTTFVGVNSTPTTPVASSNSPVCTGAILQLTVDTIPGATYTWSGPNGFNSTLQNPTISGVTAAAAGTYTVTANNGCASIPTTVTVVVNPTPNPPVASNTGPVCLGSNVNVNSTFVAGATYSWSGPNGFSSTTQNNTITGATSAEAGTYTVNITVNGCTSNNAVTTVVVNIPAVVNAGPDQSVCANNDSTILTGTSTTGSGIWATSGTGSFTPGSTALGGTYVPSNADTASGSITLTLTSTANGACPSANDQMVITITNAPVANAGADQSVCANNANVSLNGIIWTATGGQWTSSGTGSFVPSNTALNATYIPSSADTAAGTVTLYLASTGNGQCVAVMDSMVVTITDAPVVSAGADIFVCANNPNATLSGTSSTGTASWATNGSGSFSPNANTLNATYVPSAADVTSGAVQVWLTTTANGTCNAEDDTITITYTQPPTVDAGLDVTVCANNDSIAIAGTSTTNNGTWTTSGTGTFVPNANSLNTTYVPSNADTTAGTVTLTLTSTNNGGCIAVMDQLVITITDAPIADAGPDQSVCGNNSAVTLNGGVSVATGGNWSTSGTGTFSPSSSALNATYQPSSADTAAGSVMLILTTTGNGICTAVSDTMNITISNAPNVNAGGNIITCINNPVTNLNGSTSTGSGTWTTSGSGTFAPNNNTLNATYTGSAADTTAGTVTLILTSTGNGSCNPVSDTVVITYAPVPTVTTSPDQTVCANNAIVSVTGTSSTGVGSWTSSGSGTFTPSNNVSNPTYTPSAADTAAGTVTLTYSAGNSCTPVSSNITITITPAPYVLAGADQNVCANNAVTSLSGYVGGATNTGDWSTNGSGTFSPSSSSLNATYTPSMADTIAGSVMLVLTSTGNGLCNPESDTLVLTITHQPFANAGPDQNACANNAAGLNGQITGGSGTGVWTTTNGTGTFSNPNSLTSSYTPSNADTLASPIMLILTSTGNGGCNADADTMFITVNPGPVVSAGADQSVCSNNANVNLSGTVTVASGGVWTSSGNGTFNPSNTDMNPTYMPDTSDINNGAVSIYLTTTGNGLCSPVVDSMQIIFTPSPLVNAGGNQNVCAGSTAVPLGGSVTGGATTGIWTTLGSGTFTPNDSTLNATYNLSPADTVAGTVTLILTSTNNSSCNPEADTIQINITPIATALAGNDTNLCSNTAGYVLSGNVIGNSGTGYWTTSGSGTFTPDSSALNATYIPSSADTAAGTVTLYLTATNTCIPSTDSLVISFTPAPVILAGPDVVICGGGVVALNATMSGAAGVQWTTNGDGTFVPSSTVNNPTYIPGTSDTTIGTVTLVVNTTGTTLCSNTADSIVVTLGHKPFADFSSGTLCDGTAGAFTDLSSVVNDSIVTWSWTAGTDTSSMQDPNFTFTPSGSQTVTLIVTSSAGCSDTTTRTVNVNPSPIAYFGSTLTCATDGAFLDSSSIASGTIVSWNWNFGDSTNSMVQDPTHTYADTAVWYHVTLVVTSDSGCISTYGDSILFNSCEELVNPPGVPTAFTPNGDGHNDVLFVKGGPFTEFEFRVFNEWGNQIFASGDQATGWDGTYKGKPQPAGQYVWTLVGVTADNTDVNMTGSITIIR